MRLLKLIVCSALLTISQVQAQTPPSRYINSVEHRAYITRLRSHQAFPTIESLTHELDSERMRAGLICTGLGLVTAATVFSGSIPVVSLVQNYGVDWALGEVRPWHEYLPDVVGTVAGLLGDATDYVVTGSRVRSLQNTRDALRFTALASEGAFGDGSPCMVSQSKIRELHAEIANRNITSIGIEEINDGNRVPRDGAPQSQVSAPSAVAGELPLRSQPAHREHAGRRAPAIHRPTARSSNPNLAPGAVVNTALQAAGEAGRAVNGLLNDQLNAASSDDAGM